MWSHYAAHHSGICLQFEGARDPTRLNALRVEYHDEYPSLDWLADPATKLQAILLRKAPPWRYEKEYRVIHPGGAGTFVHFDPGALTLAWSLVVERRNLHDRQCTTVWTIVGIAACPFRSCMKHACTPRSKNW